MPDTAKVKIAGALAWNEVPLNRKFKDPIEQIMMFFPTTVRWVSGEPCH
jgi:hypothetical protein